jgi:hypothetical protein
MSVHLYAPVVRILEALKPNRVIDIGPGWGTYGLACRQYLDLDALHAIELRENRKTTVDAIYDWVYIGDARDAAYSPKFWGRWDTGLLIEVLDEMDPDDGHELLTRLLAAGLHVLVAATWVEDEFYDYRLQAEGHVGDTLIRLLAP